MIKGETGHLTRSPSKRGLIGSLKSTAQCGVSSIEYALALAVILGLIFTGVQFMQSPLEDAFSDASDCVLDMVNGGNANCGGNAESGNGEARGNDTNSGPTSGTASTSTAGGRPDLSGNGQAAHTPGPGGQAAPVNLGLPGGVSGTSGLATDTSAGGAGTTNTASHAATTGLLSGSATTDVNVAANCAPDPCAGGTGNPIEITTGNKYQHEVDLIYPSQLPLVWSRYYNSHDQRGLGTLGVKWRHGYMTWIKRDSENSDVRIVEQADGREIRFTQHDVSGYKAEFSQSGDLYDHNQGGYRWRWADGRILLFNSNGRLEQVKLTDSAYLNLSYDDQNRLISIEDAHQRKLQLNYINDRLSRVIGPDQQTLVYRYADDKLVEVKNQKGLGRLYHYEHPTSTYHLTSIDRLNNDGEPQQYARYEYDAEGRGISSQHADAVGAVRLTYGPSYTDVTESTGLIRRHHWIEAASGLRTISKIEVMDCTDCEMGVPQHFNYDHEQNVTEIGHPDGRIDQFEYDAHSRMINHQRLNATGEKRQISEYRYTDEDRLVDEIIRPSIVADYTVHTRLQYNAANQVTELYAQGYAPRLNDGIDILERRVKFNYDDKGRLVEIDGPRDDIADLTELTYDERGYLASIKRGADNDLRILNVDTAGRVTSLQRSDLAPYEFVYDAQGRITQINQDDIWQRYIYQSGRLVQVKDSVGRQFNYHYDVADRLIKLTDSRGRGISLQYNQANQLTAQQQLGLNGVQQSTLSWAYDQLGRLTEQRSSTRPTLNFRYTSNRLSEISEAGTPLQQFTYTTWGQLQHLSEIDEVLTRFEYNQRRQLTQVRDDNDNTSTYVYDDFGRVSLSSHPDQSDYEYRYDGANNLIKRNDPQGMIQHYRYDAANRLITIEHRDNQVTHFDYQQGQLVSMVSSGSTESYYYDNLGRLSERRVELDGRIYTTGYRYAVGGALAEKTLADGQRVQYQYTAHGELASIELIDLSGRSTKLLDELNTHADTAEHRQFRYNNGRLETRQHDTQGRISRMHIDGQLDIDYAYDAYNRINGKTIKRLGITSAKPETHHYGYDNHSRLIDAQIDHRQHQYDYDGVNNRLTQTTDTRITRYHYPPPGQGNKLLKRDGHYPTHYRYNDHGSLIEQGNRELIYDSNERLIELRERNQRIAQYRYNGWGERIEKIHYSGDGQRRTLFLYEGGRISTEIDDSGAIAAQYIYYGLRPIAKITSTGIYTIYSEFNGTPLQMADANDQVVWSARYDAYGNADIAIEKETLPLRFAGQYFDAESGYYYNYQRYYAPRLGRYLTADPIGLRGGLNHYAYVNANPVNYIDPFGLCGETPDGEAGIDGFDYDWKVELGADVAGIFEPTPFIDIANGSALMADGRYIEGGLTYLGVIPVVGDAAGKGVKYAYKGGRWVVVTTAPYVVKGVRWTGGHIADGAKWAGGHVADGARWTGGHVADGASSAWNWAGNKLGRLFGRNADEAVDGASDAGGYFGQQRKYWTDDPIEFNGNKVYQRNDQFKPNQMTTWRENGQVVQGTNLERMATGRAPIGNDGQPINLHHMTQSQDGAVAEVTQNFHQQNYGTIHINTGNLPSGINRAEFNAWRKDYWQHRASSWE